MCGIVGVWNLDGQKTPNLIANNFIDSLEHRGPDGRGIYEDKGLLLGHRRLSILDLSEAGKQPMSYANRYWITFNGEIYNFIELKNELISKGYKFKNDTDTEVILASYIEWGEDCQLKFNGMWAFAIWDSVEQTLFLSRDNFGIKPLHYVFLNNRFAFSSEMKSFLFLDWFPGGINLANLATGIRCWTTMEATEECLINNVKRLMAGHCLKINKNGIKIRRWWKTIDHIHNLETTNFEQQKDKFFDLFIDACKIRMRSDVPIGTTLSGGMDSSSVLCAINYIKNQNHNNLREAKNWESAFCSDFQGTAHDERKYAQSVVDYTKANAIFKKVEYDIDNFNNILYNFEEIYDNPSAFFLMYKEIKNNGIKIILSGDGADEQLGGYHHYPEIAAEDCKDKNEKEQLLKMLDSMGPKECNYKQYRDSLMGGGIQNSWFHPQFQQNSFQQNIENINLNNLNTRLYLDLHYYTLPPILRNYDRASMAYGVEVRPPFLDWRLVTYNFSLPNSSKIGMGYTKRILREAMKGIMPEEIRTRTSKVGWCSPATEFLISPIKEFVIETVNESGFKDFDLWNGKLIQEYINGCYTNKIPGLGRIWLIWPLIQAYLIYKIFNNKSFINSKKKFIS